MTTIGIPPRTPEEWDVPPSRLTQQMTALVARQRAQRALEIEAQCAEHLAERGQTPSPEHWVDWRDFLDIDPDLYGRDYTHPGGTRC